MTYHKRAPRSRFLTVTFIAAPRERYYAYGSHVPDCHRPLVLWLDYSRAKSYRWRSVEASRTLAFAWGLAAKATSSGQVHPHIFVLPPLILQKCSARGNRYVSDKPLSATGRELTSPVAATPAMSQPSAPPFQTFLAHESLSRSQSSGTPRRDVRKLLDGILGRGRVSSPLELLVSTP